MRMNLEDVRSYGMRSFGTKRPAMVYGLTSMFTIPTTGHEVYMFDAGGVTKTVKLPPLDTELSMVIVNIGVAGTIEVYDSNNVLQTSIHIGEIKQFFSSPSRWVWMSGSFISSPDPTGLSEELRIVTAAGAQVVSSVEAGLVINKAVASPTPVTLPLASTRVGKPIRFVDWRGTVDIANPVTLTPSGADKINNLAAWEASSLSAGGLILFPNTVLGGYTVGA